MATVNEKRWVQYLAFKTDAAWRRLNDDERARGYAEFTREVEGAEEIATHVYSTLGLKRDADLFLWRMSDRLDRLQESASRLLLTGLGRYLEISHAMTGLVRPSVYVRKQSEQEQAIYEQTRQRYLVVYPFTKTTDWYLLGKDMRQEMMNAHIRIGHQYPMVRQLLVYSTGLDDQEFIVAYETDDLNAFQELVIALRNTEARRYTLRDTPTFTCIYRPLAETLALLG